MLRIPRWVLTCASALLITPCMAFAEYNTDKIGDVLMHAHNDLTIVCAHRGLHGTAIGTNSHQDWLRNVPENSIAAIRQAASAGIECSEIDLQLDSAGRVVVIHDTNLGRTTNAFTTGRAGEYDPYSRIGYNPSLSNYFGNTLGLSLRNPSLNGFSNQTLPSFDAILDTIKNDKIAMILLLDVKNIEAAKKAWQSVKNHTNWWGTPAEKWVYFKMPVSSIGVTPAGFESKGIMNVQSEAGRFRLIPVFGADFIDTSGTRENALRNWESYFGKNYVYATEVRLKEYDSTLRFPLNNIMNTYFAMRTTQHQVKTIGAYQPVPETKFFSFFAADGHCCTEPKYWLWKSQRGNGQETGDNRTSLNWLMNTAGGSFRYIITDDPLTAITTLRNDNRRNTALISN
ncbi:Glycerophosphoryl diester phosphodiesterase family protein [Pseudomonas syringae]|nr:Glycerophosphoryl diester phosphodiesterase family protein [Pseudomonas syringae]SFM21785.1 Glycerophosphoryl diester phosphodiesterase family protein [Pseudomonas syringae]